MNAFEHQVAHEILLDVGPERPLDAMAVVRDVKSRDSRWRFQSMFSATRFVVAGAIVALFGGFLLAGVLTTQPSDETVPAAVTGSPVPATPDGPLSRVDFVTERIEPGVERIVSDGIRDLSMDGDRRVFVTPDGQVWLYTSQDDSPPTLVKLGDPGSYAEGLGAWPDIRFAPDGLPWALVGDADTLGHSIQRFDGSAWSTVRDAPTDVDPWDIGPDGVVWAGGTSGTLLRLDDSGWSEYPIDFDGLGLRPALDAFQDTMAWPPDEEVDDEPRIRGVRVDGHGAVWVELAFTGGGDPPMTLVRFDGQSWSLADPLDVETYYNVDLLDIGSDGTVWVYLETERPPGPAWEDPTPHLARLVGEEWTVFSESEGVVTSVWKRQSSGLLRVDRDGAVWLVPQADGHRGIRTFDGSTWRSFLDDDRVVVEGTADDGTTWMQSLPGYAVDDMVVAPDGDVWVLASGGLYVITPEAVAGTE